MSGLDLSDLSDLTVVDATDAYDRALSARSDQSLVAAVGDVIGRPKAAPADSFVLHAPLELLARGALLRQVEPHQRDAIRRRLVWLAASYNEAGDELAQPRLAAVESPEMAASRLVAALEAGDLDEVDRWSAELARTATPTELRRLLGAPIAASLAAAAHASIFLYLLPRVHDTPGGLGTMLRGLARDLARHPDWRLRWFDDPGEIGVGPSLEEQLLAVPMLGPVGNNFIMPIMRQAEDSGIAAVLLSGVVDGRPLDVNLIRRQLSRIAAWSMVQEPSHHAYGWSHCLTMPQAVIGLAGGSVDSRSAVAVAATHVVGFRAAMGQVALLSDFSPDPVAAADLDEAIAGGPGSAAAFAWFAARGPASTLKTELAARAGRHHDAHYAKYTLACFDAAEADPEQRALYLAAAAFLAGYWALKGDDDFLGR
ncbi:MAG: hypothetical protein M3Q68_04245 [Actinomycetota bacterium]|nr:hypothetical protein [Actinomycetota bacterium]